MIEWLMDRGPYLIVSIALALELLGFVAWTILGLKALLEAFQSFFRHSRLGLLYPFKRVFLDSLRLYAVYGIWVVSNTVFLTLSYLRDTRLLLLASFTTIGLPISLAAIWYFMSRLYWILQLFLMRMDLIDIYVYGMYDTHKFRLTRNRMGLLLISLLVLFALPALTGLYVRFDQFALRRASWPYSLVGAILPPLIVLWLGSLVALLAQWHE
jgi:hypothetical protein